MKKEKLITEIYNLSDEDSKILNEGWGRTLFSWLLVGVGGWAIYRSIRALADKKSKKCGIFHVGKKRDLCMAKETVAEIKQIIKITQDAKKRICPKSKNPEKCSQKADNTLAKLQIKLKKAEERLAKQVQKMK
ncbi:MAG: hypothetical protein KatS3mg002_0301 [Candidatus Woesearchaeota archaeon]|nr:MAG: hypothetical protein KatS3mg002_0301 [Candidatus Woesearchaeota archaeon]